MTPHTEDTRVKIPAILHLTRLGYSYLSLKGATWDIATNIFPELFHDSIAAINPRLASPHAHERTSPRHRLNTTTTNRRRITGRLSLA